MASTSTLCRQCARQAAQGVRQIHRHRTFTSTRTFFESQAPTLLPSVQHLLHENHISSEDATKIPASGPNGRLLKGDVLAYIGQVDKSYPQEQAKRIDKLSHLDLSNIKIAAPKATETSTASSRELASEEPEETEIAVPISLAAALACQKRLQDTLGISLPLTTFIARAIELANDSLPRTKQTQPTADELFESVLGLDRTRPTTSHGNYVPSIVTLPPTKYSHSQLRTSKEPDIIDILTGNTTPKVAAESLPVSEGAGAENVFSISAGKGEEQRATIFLERMKAILELEPGRLVL